MSAWNTRDWEPEDKSWELTEEDTDDEFDDNQLARLGVDLPECAKETRISMPERPESMLDMGAVLARWQQAINENPDNRFDAHRELMNALADVQPSQPWGIDPEIAGFDELDESEEEEPCPECGRDYMDCACESDIYGDDYCQACGQHYSEGCDCEY